MNLVVFDMSDERLIRRLLWIVLTVNVFFFAGCTGVMRPPSAVPFMHSYERIYTLNNVSVALYGGDLDNDESSYDDEIEMEDEHLEWVFDFSNVAYGHVGFFSAGLGLQSTTPFVQLGFVSPYVGVSAWSSLCLPTNEICLYGDGYMDNLSYGTMLIQQFPVGRRVKVGFTEHFSRNGSERYFYEVPEFFGIVKREPHPIFYREIGGGFFVSYRINNSNRIVATEFRYGRDIDFNRNRFAITMDLPIVFENRTAEERQKYNELEKALRQYESLRIATSLQKQKLNRFVRAKEMGVNVTDAEIEEERKHLQELNDLLKQQKITVRNLKKDLYD